MGASPSSEYTGPERRQYSSEFEREMYGFMARVDERNQDRDLQAAVRDEAAIDHEKRIASLEHTRTWCKGVLWTTPALATVAGICVKLGQILKTTGGITK